MIKTTHSKINTKPDGPDSSVIRPLDWNADHKIVVSPGVMGRKANTGNGPPEMLPIYLDAQGSLRVTAVGALALPSGNTVQRPSPADNGMVRYNGDTARLESYVNGVWVDVALASDAKVPTGTIAYTYAVTATAGWVMGYGTIGNAGSGAHNRANVDTLPLYKLLWENYPDAFAAVTGGRGATAEEDFFANKTMMLPDLRETVLAGSGDLGGTEGAASNNRLKSGATGGFGAIVTKGTLAGEKSHVLTVGELAEHTHVASNEASGAGSGGGSGFTFSLPPTLTGATGNDDPHNNVQPTVLLNYVVKL